MLRTITRGIAAAVVLLSLSALPSTSSAQNIVTCNNCSLSQNMTKAKAQGVGLHYIIDETQVKLRLFEVIEDSPGYLLAAPVTVPADVSARFYGVVNARLAGDPALVIDIAPGDEYPNVNYSSNPFGGFSGTNASEVINSASVRYGFGQNLGIRYGDNTLFARMTRSLNSLVMSGLGFFTGSPVDVVINVTFSDGSTCQFKISADSPQEAKFVPESARDKYGHPLPDASVNDPEVAQNYHGEYAFPDAQSAEAWVNHMQLLGVPVTTEGGSASFRYFCQMIGTELRCWKM